MSFSSDSPLRGQLALVTGGARRLGRAIAEGLAGEGCDVIIHYRRSADEAEALAEQLRSLGVQAWTIAADLFDLNSAEELVPTAHDRTGRPVDILINSASIFEPSSILEFSLDDWDRNMRVHALAPLTLSRQMARQNHPGQIINLLDTRIVDYDRLHAAYHLSKRVLFTITRMLARELAPAIRVNGVAPGLILPPEDKDESYLQRLAQSLPLKKHGGAEDIVRAVLFLLHSDFITGQVIYVDGGQHMLSNMYGT